MRPALAAAFVLAAGAAAPAARSEPPGVFEQGGLQSPPLDPSALRASESGSAPIVTAVRIDAPAAEAAELARYV
jgi:hypothetical protein